MATYKDRGGRPKTRNRSKARARWMSPLADPLISALFVHHRSYVPKTLEDRLLPMCIPQQDDQVVIKRNVFKSRAPVRVIYLPDLSGLPVPKPRLSRWASKEIIDDMLRKYNVSHKELMGFKRGSALTARQEACYLMAVQTDLSIADISKVLGKDHTTVMHAITRYCEANGLSLPRGAKWKSRYKPRECVE